MERKDIIQSPEYWAQMVLPLYYTPLFQRINNSTIKSGFVPQIEFIPTEEYLKTEGLL